MNDFSPDFRPIRSVQTNQQLFLPLVICRRQQDTIPDDNG